MSRRQPIPTSEVPVSRLPSRSALLAPYRSRAPRTQEVFEDEPQVISDDQPTVGNPPAPGPR